MALPVLPYLEQTRLWPTSGRHLLAHYDPETVVVYQAYRPSIADMAIREQRFVAGDFRFERMSWIKPNFMWMMHRSGWSKKPDQERVLAIRLWRRAFDRMLAQCVHSTYVAERYADHASWQREVRRSAVRLQWDPDHGPSGQKLQRRALQLGLRRRELATFAGEAIAGIEDMTEFAHEQYERLQTRGVDALVTPVETAYPISSEQLRSHLGLA